MPNSTIQPYLFFGGRCDEALEFYGNAVGAKVELLMRYSDSPEPVPADRLAPGFEKKVMHCTFTIGDSTLNASDGCDGTSNFEGFSLSLNAPSQADAEKAFKALSEGGNVTMPLTKTFWSPCFGMLTDRFGMGWMIIVPGTPHK